MEAYSMDEIAKNCKEIEWVWKNYIPRRAVTILAAKGGVGKSAFALFIASEIARKQGLKTLYADYEQTTPQHKERFNNWNLFDIKELIKYPASLDEFGQLENAGPSLIELEDISRKFKPDLIIIDSSTSLYGTYDMGSRQGGAKFVNDYRRIAVAHNTGLLVLNHTNKAQINDVQQVAVDTISGSAALVDLSRSVLFMSRSKENSDIRLVQQLKHNFTARQPDITFSITDTGIIIHETVTEPECIPTGIPIYASMKETHTQIMLQGLKQGITSKKELRQLILSLPPEEGGNSAQNATIAYKELINRGYIKE